MRQTNRPRTTFIAILLGIAISTVLFATFVSGVPGGPSVSYLSNLTSSNLGATAGDTVNHTGGVIAVANLNHTQQNTHWKAYVGNVTGSLSLRDSGGYAIYDWSFATITGEVYATRASSTVTWSSVECANSTHVNNESDALNHTSTFTDFDSISLTFDDNSSDHDEFMAGPTNISENSCNYTIQTYVGSGPQTSTELFEEVLLWDDSAYIIYVTIMENDQGSYHTGEPYDYQLLLPEKGEPEWSGVTQYYFYVELG